MAFRLYITPSEGDPFSEQGAHPKYFSALPADSTFSSGFVGLANYLNGFDPTMAFSDSRIASFNGGDLGGAATAIVASKYGFAPTTCASTCRDSTSNRSSTMKSAWINWNGRELRF